MHNQTRHIGLILVGYVTDFGRMMRERDCKCAGYTMYTFRDRPLMKYIMVDGRSASSSILGGTAYTVMNLSCDENTLQGYAYRISCKRYPDCSFPNESCCSRSLNRIRCDSDGRMQENGSIR